MYLNSYYGFYVTHDGVDYREFDSLDNALIDAKKRVKACGWSSCHVVINSEGKHIATVGLTKSGRVQVKKS